MRNGVPHFTQTNNLLLSSHRIWLDDTERCADAQRTINDVHSENDGITFGKASDGTKSTRPDSLRSSVSSLGFHHFGVVSSESVEKVVNNIGCTGSRC